MILISLFAAGVKEKNTFFLRKYLYPENSGQQASPAHEQRVETTTMDELCQLKFNDFEVFF